MAIYLILSLFLTVAFGEYFDCEFYLTQTECTADSACLYSGSSSPSCYADCSKLSPPICDDYGCIEQDNSCIVGTTTTTSPVGTPSPVDISSLTCSGTSNVPPLGRSSYICDVGNEVCRYIDINSNCVSNCGSESDPYPNFQMALDGINQATVTLIVKPGTYTGIGNYDIYAHNIFLEIRSESGSADTIIDCQGEGYGFHFYDVTIYQMSGFTIKNCVAPQRSPWSNLPDYARDNPYIPTDNMTSPGRLGAAFFMDRVWSNFTDMVIIDNCAEFGGAIFQYQHSLHLYNSVISYNYAAHSGAGIYALFANAYMYNTLITCNEAEIFGGGLFDYQSRVDILEQTAVSDNIGQYANEFYCDKATVHVDTVNGGMLYDNDINNWNHNEIVYCCCSNCAFYEGPTQQMNFCAASNNNQVNVVQPQDYHYEQCIPTEAPTTDPTTDPSKAPTSDPTQTPTMDPSKSPTTDPTKLPTTNPTGPPTTDPTKVPTINPTGSPTTDPTTNPTKTPTTDPSKAPTTDPTKTPTADPSKSPTTEPTQVPTTDPSKSPTTDPTGSPTINPTGPPTTDPTKVPTTNPTYSPTTDPTTNPTKTPTTDPSKAPTTDPSKSPTTDPTKTPTADPSKSPTTEPTKTPTTDPTGLPTTEPTQAPTTDPSKSPTTDPTGSPTSNPTTSPTTDPTKSPTTEPTQSPTSDPTKSPSTEPTTSPTTDPSKAPTIDPTKTPTTDPTTNPTKGPTTDPTKTPTSDPTTDPTKAPTTDPTKSPTNVPSTDPTKGPTADPTKTPTSDPTTDPTKAPTTDPTKSPTNVPSTDPTKAPTNVPSTDPTKGPTSDPTTSPTTNPSRSPTSDPTGSPSTDPTHSPTSNPTKSPTTDPTKSPTSNPTKSPTTDPTKSPSTEPTPSPTSNPTKSPTSDPSKSPTTDPTESPTTNPSKSPTTDPTSPPTKAPTTDIGCDNGVVRNPQLGRSSYKCGAGETCVYIANNSVCTSNCGLETAPYSTFQAALDGIRQQTVTIIVKPGIYTGEGNMNIFARNIFLNIRSESGSEETIIDCQGNGFGFHFYQVTISQMTGFTIQNCEASERSDFVVPSYAENEYIKNTSKYEPGARLGGAFFMDHTWSNMSDIVLIDNSAEFGGAVFQFGQSLNLYNSIIEYNCASNSGGALFLLFANAYLYNTYVQCNSAEVFGGGLFTHSSRADILDRTIIRDNIGQYANEVFCDKSTTNVDIIGNSLIFDNQINSWEDNEITYCCCNNCAFFEGPQQQINFCAASDTSKVNVVEPTSDEECSVRGGTNAANSKYKVNQVIFIMFLAIFVTNI